MQVNVAADIRIDPMMYTACHNILTSKCSDIKPENGRLVECLSSNINSNDMQEECRKKILDIQFFKGRDWSLNPKLYKNCKNDAIKFCNAKEGWFHETDKQTMQNYQSTLPCLFGYHIRRDNYTSENNQLSFRCSETIRRTMIIRAKNIGLMPGLQIGCRQSLAKFCQGKYNETNTKGNDLKCLQNNFKSLDQECKIKIDAFNSYQSKDIQLDDDMYTQCLPLSKSVCDDQDDLSKLYL